MANDRALTLKVEGLNELRYAVATRMDARTTQKVLRKGLQAAVGVTRPVAKTMAPVQDRNKVHASDRAMGHPGRTKRAVGGSTKVPMGGDPIGYVYIAPGKGRRDKRGAFWRYAIVKGQQGTRDRLTNKRQRQSLMSFTRSGRAASKARGLYGGRIKVNGGSGVPANPFIDRAVAATSHAAMGAFSDTYKRFLNDEAFRGTLKGRGRRR